MFGNEKLILGTGRSSANTSYLPTAILATKFIILIFINYTLIGSFNSNDKLIAKFN
jgi:hypothetical protein